MSKRPKRRKPTVLDRAKRAARDRWREVFANLAPTLLLTDPRCPICGSRFQRAETFEQTGAGACDQCGRFKHGERILRRKFGFATNASDRNILAMLWLIDHPLPSMPARVTGGG